MEVHRLLISSYTLCYCWKHQSLTVPFAHGIVVEEINVKTSLNDTTQPTDPVDVSLNEVPVDPIQDIEEPIRSHSKDKVRSQILNLAKLLE